MFELTNEQRKCLGLSLISEDWIRVEVKPRRFCVDSYYQTFAFIDGRSIKKVVQIREEHSDLDSYWEWDVDEMLSEDGEWLLPKTEKGKSKRLTPSTLSEKAKVGMSFSWIDGEISLVNMSTDREFYSSRYEGPKIENWNAFEDWVTMWCSETTEEDLQEIDKFAKSQRIHQEYQEGDFFRFRINRHLYGYGRVLVDYGKMRKQGVPFWDIFMGLPLCVAVYHILSERPDLNPEELVGKMMLPSQMIMDNAFFFGEYQVIGNLPLTTEVANCTVHYGPPLDRVRRGVCYQCGKKFVVLENQEPLFKPKGLFEGFTNNAIGYHLEVDRQILEACIAEQSNAPYWEKESVRKATSDLRCPCNAEALKAVRRQMGIDTDEGK